MRRWIVTSGLIIAFANIASADTYLYTSALNGFQEVPSTNSQGVGLITLTLDDTDFSVSGSGLVFFLSGAVTDFHIHNAPFGVNGPVVVPIGASGISGNTVNFDITLANATAFSDLKAILDAENGYFNIHTNLFPTGEIRGQIAPVLIPEPATCAVLGLAVAALVRRRRKA